MRVSLRWSCIIAEYVGPSALEQLMQHVCLMVGSRTRDVVKSAFGFLKVALLLLDASLLGRHLQTMVRGGEQGRKGRVLGMGIPARWLFV